MMVAKVLPPPGVDAMPPPGPLLEPLVEPVLDGVPGAWQALWRALERPLDALLRRPAFLGPLAGNEDHRRSVVVTVMERLAADGHARLRAWHARRHAHPALLPWLAVVTKRVAIDHLRAQPEFIDRRARGEQAGWHQQVTWTNDGATRPPFTSDAEARRLLELAEQILEPPQREALARWLRGDDWSAVGEALAASPRDAERLVRAALERLRRRVRNGAGS
jgi:DNA-directed RNA polymerase specialized sigma24 family protein